MSRNYGARRFSFESNFTDEVDLIFLDIYHPTLDDSIRVVNDNNDYIFDFGYYIGFPFDITILSDDDKPPKAQLGIQNIDPRIGDTIRALVTPPRIRIRLLSSADFNVDLNPRAPTFEPRLVLHFNGTDASTAMVDDSSFDRGVTANGSAQLDTAQKKFGVSSCLFNGSTDDLTVDASDDFAFFTGDFLVHAQVRPRTSVSGQHAIYATDDFEFYMDNGHLKLWLPGPGDVIVSATTMAINTWYHVAFARLGGTFRIFLNGVGQGDYTADVNFTNNVLTIGSDNGGSEKWNGWTDECFVIKGATYWWDDFSPPDDEDFSEFNPTTIYDADRLFLINVTVDIMAVTGDIVGWDFVQRVWPGQRASQANFPGLFR